MAVELRCPKCEAKLRLPDDPDPDTEVECPKCDHVFVPARATVPAADAPPRKKKPAADDGGAPPGEKPRKKKKKKGADGAAGEKEKAAPADAQGKGPKKRKAKKKKTPPAVIAGIVVGALMVVGMVAGVLVWYLTKKGSGQEMMSYLPAECDEVTGVNVGHLRKYPGFYEACKQQMSGTGFFEAGELFAKALGQDFDATVEYVTQGAGSSGGKPLGATVLRTVAEFDPGAVAKIPGAKKYTLAGADYYAVPDLPKLGYPGLRVFAPTNRLVVFCRGDMPEAAFKSALTGNKDAPDQGVYARSGALGKATSRGTVWQFTLYGKAYKPPPRPKQDKGQGGEDADLLFREELAGVLGSAQGYGIKASVGSRDTRGEWIVWYKDSDAASEAVKKWKEKPWVKDDEENPPRYYKSVAYKSGLGKTAENVIRDGLSFRSSGELFTIRTEAPTKMLQQGVGGLVGQFNAPAQPAN
jgi:DNA-directed RNA polymerase subunit RPC12/RpoP